MQTTQSKIFDGEQARAVVHALWEGLLKPPDLYRFTEGKEAFPLHIGYVKKAALPGVLEALDANPDVVLVAYDSNYQCDKPDRQFVSVVFKSYDAAYRWTESHSEG